MKPPTNTIGWLWIYGPMIKEDLSGIYGQLINPAPDKAGAYETTWWYRECRPEECGEVVTWCKTERETHPHCYLNEQRPNPCFNP